MKDLRNNFFLCQVDKISKNIRHVFFCFGRNGLVLIEKGKKVITQGHRDLSHFSTNLLEIWIKRIRKKCPRLPFFIFLKFGLGAELHQPKVRQFCVVSRKCQKLTNFDLKYFQNEKLKFNSEKNAKKQHSLRFQRHLKLED